MAMQTISEVVCYLKITKNIYIYKIIIKTHKQVSPSEAVCARRG